MTDSYLAIILQHLKEGKELQLDKSIIISLPVEEIINSGEIECGDNEMLGRYFWSIKLYKNAIIKFSQSYNTNKDFKYLDLILNCWKDAKEQLISHPTFVLQLSKQLFNEAINDNTEWKFEDRLDVTEMLTMHGVYQYSRELSAHLLTISENLERLIYYYGLSESGLGNSKQGTKKLKIVTNNLIKQYSREILNNKKEIKIYHSYKGIKNQTNKSLISYEELDTDKTVKFGENSKSNPPSNLLELPNIKNYTTRDIYVVEYKQIQFEYLSLLHNNDDEFFVLESGLLFIPFFNKILNDLKKLKSEDVLDDLIPLHVNIGIYIVAWTNNYYHWVIESLSRILLLRKIGFFNKYPDAKIILNRKSSFILNSLRSIDIFEDHVVFMEEGKHQVFVERLFSISILPWKQFDFPCMHHQIPSYTSIRLLNQHYNPNPLPLEKRNKIIYIPRNCLIRGTNEFDEIFIKKMKELYPDNFIIHDPNISFQDQILMFKDVRLIVGPHGAGLSNIIFATPGSTVLIEFPVKENSLQFFYSHITAALDFYHWMIPSVSSTYYGYYPKNEDTVSNLITSISSAMAFLDSKIIN